MAVNDQYLPGQAPFGLSAAIAQTGAPGSPGITAAETAGAEVGRPTVSVPGASSQLPESMPRVSVTAGDTSAMSSDAPVPPGGDPLTGIPLSDIASMGPYPAWHDPYPHPGAGGRA
jgi:hypothetical protein